MFSRVWALVLLACGMASGQSPVSAISPPVSSFAPDQRVFDAVSIKESGPGEAQGLLFGFLPSGFLMRHQPMAAVVMAAYFPLTRMFGYSTIPIVGAPDWLRKDLYDINARYDEVTAKALMGLNGIQRQETSRPMLQATLAERCKLIAHMTMVDGPVYELVVSRHGEKLKPTGADEDPPEHAIPIAGDAMMVPIYPPPAKQELAFFGTSMSALATYLSTMLDRQVVDRTGLAGTYDFAVPRLRRDASDTEGSGVASDPNRNPFIWDVSALRLELRPAKGPQPVLVIDHIEKPTAN